MFWTEKKRDPDLETDDVFAGDPDFVGAALCFAEEKKARTGLDYVVVLTRDGDPSGPIEVEDWGPGWIRGSWCDGTRADSDTFLNTTSYDQIDILWPEQEL